MPNFNSKHFLSLAVLVLGIFASQCLQAEAQCDSAMALMQLDCAACTTATCVWCGTTVTVSGSSSEAKTLPIGVCMQQGDACDTVVSPPGIDALVGTYTIATTTNVVQTTIVSHTSVTTCPAATAGFATPGLTQATNCTKCQAASVGSTAGPGIHCKISIGSDASPDVKTSTVCLTNNMTCATLSTAAFGFDAIWIESAEAPAQCAGFDDAMDLVALPSCRNETNCAACKAQGATACQWCQSSVMDSASAVVGTLLQNFGKCEKTSANCDSRLTYDGLKPVANATFGSVAADTTTFAVAGGIIAGPTCTALAAVERVALADLSTSAKCMAVAGLSWCELELKKDAVAPSSTGGVCVQSAATCTGYAVSTAVNGYTLEATLIAGACAAPGVAANPDCASCQSVGCVWCGSKIVVGQTETDLQSGVCIRSGDTCANVVQPAGLDALVGTYSYDGKNVRTTSISHSPITNCPAESAGHVALGAVGADDCAKCIGASGNFCKISVGTDASDQVMTSELCLSNSAVCANLSDDDLVPIWIATIGANAAASCSATDLVPASCRSRSDCAGCVGGTCKWCRAKVLDSTPATVGTLLQDFGKCKSLAAVCEGLETFDGLSPVAETSFGQDTTTFETDEILAAATTCTATAVDLVALADFPTCERCMAVTGLVWCQLGLRKGNVAGTTFGGVCAMDTATCTAYRSDDSAGYTLTTQVVTCPTPTPEAVTTTSTITTSGVAPKPVGGAALLSVVVAMIWM